MQLFKLAAEFQGQLQKKADKTSLQTVYQIRQAARDLLQLKDLLLNASDNEQSTQATLTSLDSTSKQYYLTARDYGLSRSSHAGFLHTLMTDVEQLSTITGGSETPKNKAVPRSPQLDPSVYAKLSNLRNLITNTIPVALQPEKAGGGQTATGNQPPGTGNSSGNNQSAVLSNQKTPDPYHEALQAYQDPEESSLTEDLESAIPQPQQLPWEKGQLPPNWKYRPYDWSK